MKIAFRRFRIFALVLAFLVAGVPLTLRADSRDSKSAASAKVTKPVSCAVLEDYDKAHDLNDVALDFQLLNELRIVDS